MLPIFDEAAVFFVGQLINFKELGCLYENYKITKTNNKIFAQIF